MYEIQFVRTPHNSIRVWLHFEENKLNEVRDSKEFALFQMLSIWGGYDKDLKDLFSWELSLTLKDYIVEKFSNYKNCTIDLH